MATVSDFRCSLSFSDNCFSLVHIPITIIYILFLCRPSLVYLLYYFRKINGWNSGQIVRNKYYFLAQLDLSMYPYVASPPCWVQIL